MHPNEKGYYPLDYSLKTSAERADYVSFIIENTPPSKLTSHYKELLTDYILSAEYKKQRDILTPNRLATINKREISIEQITENAESAGEGSVNTANKVNALLTRRPDPSQRLTNKYSITPEDVETIPGLKQLQTAIKETEEAAAAATGYKRFKLKQTAIELRKDQYLLKNSAKPTIFSNFTAAPTFTADEVSFNEYDNITVDKTGQIHSNSKQNFFNKDYISALCQNYDLLKQWADDHCGDNLYHTYKYFTHLLEDLLKPREPIYYDLLLLKNYKKTNAEIHDILKKKYNISFSFEYYSVMWRKKLPLILTKYAEDEFIDWYFTYKEKGSWKRCLQCGQVKLRINRFFSHNKCSTDGFYSVCKECRSKKYYASKRQKEE